MRLMLSEIDRLSVGEVVYPPGGTLGPRWQRDTQLVLVHSGGARVWVDEEPPLALRPGRVGLLRPGHWERFAFAEREPTRHSWVQLPLALPHGLPRELAASRALAELIRGAVEAEGELAAALSAAALWRYAADASRPEGVVERARAFIGDNLADPDLDLARIARAAHVTPAHLVRRFRAETGVTPMAHVWERRVAAGIDLLSDTGLPVGTIAARTGFKSVQHFSRRVRAAAGKPPARVRREAYENPRSDA
jgi:AraC family transcriptional regulator of arabinose operon